MTKRKIDVYRAGSIRRAANGSTGLRGGGDGSGFKPAFKLGSGRLVLELRGDFG